MSITAKDHNISTKRSCSGLLRKFLWLFLLSTGILMSLQAQVNPDDDGLIDYNTPAEYEIGGITISGIQYLDQKVLIMLSGMAVGDKIKVPGEEVSDAIKKLWEQGLFEHISISITKIQRGLVFLNIDLKERPRLSKYAFTGLKKGEKDNMKDELKIVRGDVVTDNLLVRIRNTIYSYFEDKGYLNTEVFIKQVPDTTRANHVILIIDVEKHEKIKVFSINIEGNEFLDDQRIKKVFKETKEKGYFRPLANMPYLIYQIVNNAVRLRFYSIVQEMQLYVAENMRIRLFKSSKFIEGNFETDQENLVKKYNTLGFRDFKIIKDSIYRHDDKSINIDLILNEGNRYYFRNITWVGNTKYTSDELDLVLGIKKGDVYNKDQLDTKLNFDQNGYDISSIYMDQGYLFFQAMPVEVLVENDSIDVEIRLREGKQARINRVSVVGNTKTNDHVVMREIRTQPGDLFSRSNIIRTIRELGQLRYFNPETINPEILPNPEDGTVDIIYHVEETSADQIELSGGWGYGRIIGTLGLTFNNFSLRNFFKKGAWKPVPSGDGQKLSLRVQSYGRGYISYSASFTEPWLGGKKPKAFSVSYYHSRYTNGLNKNDLAYSYFKINGLSFGLSKRLKWPDDYFTIYHGINLQRYDLNNWSEIIAAGGGTGFYNNFNYNIIIGRNSTSPSPIYPRNGSDISVSLELTPPYSLLSNKDYSTMIPEEKYRWIEYYKWKVRLSFFLEIFDKMVLHARIKFGFLAAYNEDVGVTPFDRFYLGGDGLTGYNQLDGREIIGMRGYDRPRLITPAKIIYDAAGGIVYDKYTLELRYPLSLNPSATIYVMGFLEAGNNFVFHKDYDPFNVYRSAGFGVRIFLPMFGVLGLDWGYGFDDVPIPGVKGGSNFHFSINQSID